MSCNRPDVNDYSGHIGAALRSLNATKDLDDFVSTMTRISQNGLDLNHDICVEFMKTVEPVNIAKLTEGQQKMFKVGFL